jgi:hypothetical protein
VGQHQHGEEAVIDTPQAARADHDGVIQLTQALV